MKVADTKIIKGIKEFLSEILSDVSVDFNFWADDVIKGKNLEKGSFGFNLVVAPDNLPDIFDEEEYLKKIKSKLDKQIGKEIRYLKVHWSFQDDVAVKSEQRCCISFEVKLA